MGEKSARRNCLRLQELNMPSSYRVCHESMEGRISKRMFQENKARQIFQKMDISYPLIRTCISSVNATKSAQNGQTHSTIRRLLPASCLSVFDHFVRIWSYLLKKYVCVWGGKKCPFFGKLVVLYFFETPVLRFALLPYYWRSDENKVSFIF